MRGVVLGGKRKEGVSTKYLSLRITPDIRVHLNDIVEARRREQPGQSISSADVVRGLIENAHMKLVAGKSSDA